MTNSSRFQSLESRHAELENNIASEMKNPIPDTTSIAKMKKEKLRIKDEILRLSA